MTLSNAENRIESRKTSEIAWTGLQEPVLSAPVGSGALFETHTMDDVFVLKAWLSVSGKLLRGLSHEEEVQMLFQIIAARSNVPSSNAASSITGNKRRKEPKTNMKPSTEIYI